MDEKIYIPLSFLTAQGITPTRFERAIVTPIRGAAQDAANEGWNGEGTPPTEVASLFSFKLTQILRQNLAAGKYTAARYYFAYPFTREELEDATENELVDALGCVVYKWARRNMQRTAFAVWEYLTYKYNASETGKIKTSGDTTATGATSQTSNGSTSQKFTNGTTSATSSTANKTDTNEGTTGTTNGTTNTNNEADTLREYDGKPADLLETNTRLTSTLCKLAEAFTVLLIGRDDLFDDEKADVLGLL